MPENLLWELRDLTSITKSATDFHMTQFHQFFASSVSAYMKFNYNPNKWILHNVCWDSWVEVIYMCRLLICIINAMAKKHA